MGCDIHLFAEVLIKDAWYFNGQLNMDRYYRLFARMGNVRNDGQPEITPLSNHRGWPDNATFLSCFHSEQWDIDGHSHSWLDSKEVCSLYEWLTIENGNNQEAMRVNTQLGWLFGNFYMWFHKYRSDYPKELQDFRWLFFFDN